MDAGSLLPPCGSQGPNSSHQFWSSVPLYTEPSHWPTLPFCMGTHVIKTVQQIFKDSDEIQLTLRMERGTHSCSILLLGNRSRLSSKANDLLYRWSFSTRVHLDTVLGLLRNREGRLSCPKHSFSSYMFLVSSFS